MMTSGKAFHPLWFPYTQMLTAKPPLKVIKTQGSYLYLEDGRMLIDGIASWWTACHGYNHPAIVDAMTLQVKAFPHVMMAGLSHDPALKLAEKLAALLPGDLQHVFFSESGSVAVEVALKMAIQYWRQKGQPRRTRFLAFSGAYHGDTMGAMAISDTQRGMHEAYSGAVQPQCIVPLPQSDREKEDFDRYLSLYKSQLAAVIIEPMLQGAGGMRLHDESVLQFIAETAKRHHVLLICDEIFTGFGRTGKMFAIEHAQIVPDIIVLSKALSGGTMPLAATVATKSIFQAFLSEKDETAFMHGPTYMGHALACQAALASLSLFETENRLQAVRVIERQLQQGLGPLLNEPGVKAVRVKGAMGAVELQRLDSHWARDRAEELGVFLRPFSNILYTTPAFTIEKEALASIQKVMHTIVKESALRKKMKKIA